MNPKEIQCVHCGKMIPNDGYGLHECDSSCNCKYCQFVDLLLEIHFEEMRIGKDYESN